MHKMRLKPKEDRRILRGHLWAYRNEFAEQPSNMADGDVVEVLSDIRKPVGRGFYQAEGGIAVRFLTKETEDIDEGLLRRRIERARHYRERIYPGSTTYRWIFGESDGLPGLIADRYGSVVSVHTPCAFYAAWAESMAAVFLESPGVESVRFSVNQKPTWFGNAKSPAPIELNGLTFNVNVESGQKTGFYLDQRDNCLEAAVLAKGSRVLDGHCFAGLWSCHMAHAGAASVLGVDTSQPAIDTARANAEANGLADRIQFECDDIQNVLRRGGRYNVVIIDPPALAKSRAHTEKAMGVYQALNKEAMKVIESGGFLVTSSCSHFVDMEAFMEMIKRSARAARREVWVVSRRGAARDHPVLLGMPETDYLKCVTLRVF